MKAIGFKNFRRFENLEPLQLSGVNFFVGGNNSGKSTVVKAMMLLMDNLCTKYSLQELSEKSLDPSFRLDANHIHNVHVGTFGRALHKPYPEVKEIEFETIVDNYRIAYTITGDEKATSSSTDVKRIEVENIENKVRYIFDFETKDFIVKYNTAILKKYPDANTINFGNLMEFGHLSFLLSRGEKLDSRMEKLYLSRYRELLKEAKDSLKTETDPAKVAQLNNEIKNLNKKIKQLTKTTDPFAELKIEDREYRASLNVDKTHSLYLIPALLDFQWMCYGHDRAKFPKDKNKRAAFFDDLPIEEKALICMFGTDTDHIKEIIRKKSIEYISAHTASQKVLFTIEDKNDYMTQVIRDYVAERITRGSELHQFICDWLFKHFKIAFDFEINPIEGEAYTMDIFCVNDEKMPLADLGMGSVQLILLLLRLATIINNLGDFAIKGTTFIIEEPEQNIHPKLQSKLADLFAYVNTTYGCQFIIETHSEYMIRRTQAMIATGEMPFENNPFKVYYFPQEGEPYDMEYQKSGRFVQSFGHGFFDESAKHTMEISKKELQEEASITFNWDN